MAEGTNRPMRRTPDRRCNMVYMMIHSWHILYSMKPCLIYATEGFDGGFNKKSHLWGLNYIHEGKHYDVGGG